MTPKPNTFTTYKLTPAELTSGSILTIFQLAVIQNQISELAEQKLNVVYDPANHSDYGIQLAFKSGQMAALQYLVDVSEEVSKQLANPTASQPESNSF